MIKTPKGKWCHSFLDIFLSFVSNIIKTKSINIITAPIYKIKIIRAKNSHSKTKKSSATVKKLKIKNSKAKNVFCTRTTDKEFITISDKRIFIIIFDIFFNKSSLMRFELMFLP